jgi:hypothetical protein
MTAHDRERTERNLRQWGYAEAARQKAIEHLACGTLVRITSIRTPLTWPHESDLAVVLADRGERVKVAPLGGFEDRYATLPRRSLTVVDPATVINERPF